MKQILFLFAFLALAMTATAQTGYLDRAQSYDKAFKTRVEVALKELAHQIATTPADSIYLNDAATILRSSNLESIVKIYVGEAAARDVNPNLSDSALRTGLRAVFIRQYWLRQFLAGTITATEFYAQ